MQSDIRRENGLEDAIKRFTELEDWSVSLISLGHPIVLRC